MLRLPLDQLQQVDAIAVAAGENRSTALRSAIRAGLAFLAMQRTGSGSL